MSWLQNIFTAGKAEWREIEASRSLAIQFVSAGSPAGEAERSRLETGLSSEGLTVDSWSLNSVSDSGWQTKLAAWRDLIGNLSHCDLVHVRCYSGPALLSQALPAITLARFFGKKSIIQFGSADIEERLEKYRRWVLPVLRLADRVLVGSRYMERVFKRAKLPVARMVDPVPVDQVQTRAVSSLQPRILVDVPLEADHNLTGMIRAFRLVKQKYPRAELVLTGQGSQAAGLEQIIQQQRISGVEMLAESGARQQLELCDLYVNPSSQDESPVGMVLAMAAGLPVVTTDADGLLHMVRHGQTGLVVPVGDYVALADSIIELIENQELTEDLSTRGLVEAQKHSWSRLRQDWMNLYAELGCIRN